MQTQYGPSPPSRGLIVSHKGAPTVSPDSSAEGQMSSRLIVHRTETSKDGETVRAGGMFRSAAPSGASRELGGCDTTLSSSMLGDLETQ
jgi:hypothetical protein